MEPPPLPSNSRRFRLRVQIYPPQEAYNLKAAPLRQFTIVKTPALALPDLTLQELCDEVVERFKVIYPGESLFAIEKPQDSYGSDLYLGDRVRDVFEDNEIFRVIKGATIRASVDPHRARSQSVQASEVFHYGSKGGVKRIYGYSEAEDSLRAQKRQRIVTDDPDRPIRSRERDTVEREVRPPGELAEAAIFVQDSQETTTKDLTGRGIDSLSQATTEVGRMNPTRPLRSGLVDRGHSNLLATSSTSHQHISTPPSITSSKDEAAASDSDVQSPRSRAISRSKRKLNFTDDFSEQDRGHSISTAVTTPQSVLQPPKIQSPMIDNKKLRRPTVRGNKSVAEGELKNKTLPRQNVYEVIETDSERPSVKTVHQEVSSTISNSYKWKAYRSSTTPNSDKSSPSQHRNTVTKQKDIQIEDKRLNHDELQKVELEPNRVTKLAKQREERERSRLAFEAVEKKRLDAEEKEKERQAKLEGERQAAEKLRKEVEAKKTLAKKQAEAEVARKRDALAKAEAVKAAQLAEKARKEAEAEARLKEQSKARFEEEERAREASEAERLQMEIDTIRKAEKENDLTERALFQSRQENEQKSQNLKASLEATVRRAASTPVKAVSEHHGYSATEATPQANSIAPISSAGSITSSNKWVTCTPFIPRGKQSGFSPATLRPSEATADSLPTVSSPNVGLEDQMPLPPQLKRKVSFADQAPPSGRRCSSTSSALKQTTLVPPRLGITDVKSTPRRTPLRTSSTGSKPPKGKAKVVESPGKPPTPTIEISSDEESAASSSEPALQHNSFGGVGSPGPAYLKPAARQVLSLPTSRSFTDVIDLDGKAEPRHSMNHSEAEKISKENLTSPRKSSTDPVSHAPKNTKNSSTPDSSASRARLSTSPTTAMPNFEAQQSQGGSLTQSHHSPEVTKTPQPPRNKPAGSGQRETEQRSMTTDDDSEDESDSTESLEALKSADNPSSVKPGQDEANHLKEDQSEETDDAVEEESDSDEAQSAPQSASIQAFVKNKQNKSKIFTTDMESNTETRELDVGPGTREAGTQDESTDKEIDEYSDVMQAQVDDQLLTQSFDSSSSLEQLSSAPKFSKVLPTTAKDVALLQNHRSGRPSLRRMNLEAQRTREANLEAAKARGLEKAQKMRADARPSGLQEEGSEEVSSSELNSTSSEYETDEDQPVTSTRSSRSRAGNAEENHGDLSDEDVEELSEQLLAESADRNATSSARTSALKSPSKGSDLMFQPASKLQSNVGKKDGKNSTKIGWAKLSKQFLASKHKTGV